MSMNDTKRNGSAIAARDLTKVYKLYDNVRDQAIDVTGLNWLFFWRKIKSRAFPALNGINVEIKHGERVGIIGQNGAGKTTFLKLITGAIAPSSGELEINGDIQALMQVGLGFHPEFSGRENIDASLLYSGLAPDEKKVAEQDVIDFCELGQFLDQPLKTYSLGMQSRLQFACATAIKPDILVVDEILGAGDAYFSMKSSARMERLTKSGCTLLLVSHSMGQVLQFCERVIWINEGKIAQDGPALQVVKAYEQWMHEKSLGKGLKSNVHSREPLVTIKDDSLSNNEKPSSDVRENKKEKASPQPEKKQAALAVPSRIDERSRWKTENTGLLIHNIRLLDEKNQANNVFPPDTNMSVEVQIEAQKTGEFPCAVVVHIMTEDGRSVLWNASEAQSLSLKKNEIVSIRLFFKPLMLNSGRFTVASALFDQIIPVNKGAAYRYDLVSRTCNFAIMDAHDGNESLFRHPAKWGKIDNQSSSIGVATPSEREHSE